MTISIVTVCYNAESSIRNVMDSVLRQTYTDFEYIIQDGASTDSTYEIIQSYIPKFQEKGIVFSPVSMSDEGLYDAMNKAVLRCHGTWVNFMNADDRFFSDNTLQTIFYHQKYDTSSVLYGDATEYEFGKYYLFYKCFDKIEARMPFSHQSSFIRRDLLLQYPFDIRYRIGADYNLLLTLYKKGLIFTDINTIVCIVSKDGLSSVNLYDTFVESVTIRKEHGIQQFSESEYAKKIKHLRFRQFGMDHFPKWLKCSIRKLQRIKRGQNQIVNLPNSEG